MSSTLHESLIRFIALLQKTYNRDKLSKLIQYSARCAAFYLNNEETKQKAALLYKGTSQARKLTRLFRSLEVIAAFKDLKKHYEEAKGDILDLRTVQKFAAKFYYALYFFYDHLVWLGSIKVLTRDVSEYKQKSMMYWLFASLAVLSERLFTLKLLYDDRNEDIDFKVEGRKVGLDIVQSGCDACVALHGSGYGNFLNDGLLGACGMVSAGIGIYKVW